VIIKSDLENEWEHFNKKLHTDEKTSEIQTPKQAHHKSTQETIVDKIVGTQDVELIHATPTSEIILRIKEIPPLDIFYSLAHKVFVKTQRKKIKLDATTVTTLDNEPMDIVWKDLPMDPSENLKKLS